ncbi:MAG: hypothetical protein KGS61_05540 [Verrucomicrobia bacterium]|nr:hypothetical protein [Verrucomicrobiota bacterium]
MGDAVGAIADDTAVIEMTDAPKASVASALVGRGLKQLVTGAKASAVNDLRQVLILSDVPADQVVFASNPLFRLLWFGDDHVAADEVLDRFATLATTWPKDQSVEAVTQFLSNLASAEMREGWPRAWHRL